jgi:hypothetical protein
MDIFRIKKEDYGKVFVAELLYDQPREGEPNRWGKKEYFYGVQTGGQQRQLQASEALHKELGNFKKGDMVEIILHADGKFGRWEAKPHGQDAPPSQPSPQPADFAFPADVEREQKKEYWAGEREAKNRISALASAVELFNKASEGGAWSQTAEAELLSVYRSCKAILDGKI